MSEVLARLHIRQVHLHHRQRGNAAHGIAQRHRSVGVSAGIEHHAEQVRLVGRRLKAVDEHPFVIALQVIDDQRAVVAAAQFVDDVGQRRVAVNLRFATPEKIEVGPVEHQHMRQSRHKHGRQSTCFPIGRFRRRRAVVQRGARGLSLLRWGDEKTRRSA